MKSSHNICQFFLQRQSLRQRKNADGQRVVSKCIIIIAGDIVLWWGRVSVLAPHINNIVMVTKYNKMFRNIKYLRLKEVNPIAREREREGGREFLLVSGRKLDQKRNNIFFLCKITSAVMYQNFLQKERRFNFFQFYQWLDVTKPNIDQNIKNSTQAKYFSYRESAR